MINKLIFLCAALFLNIFWNSCSDKDQFDIAEQAILHVVRILEGKSSKQNSFNPFNNNVPFNPFPSKAGQENKVMSEIFHKAFLKAHEEESKNKKNNGKLQKMKDSLI